MISNKAKIACLIGNPISHSLSPKLHNYLLQKYQIDGVYLPFHVKHGDDIAGVIKTFADLNFAGFNVTVPYKEKIIKHCHHVSQEAREIGAVNTVVIKDQKIYGDNSDGFGYLANLQHQFPNFEVKDKQVVILGAGGAARAIIHALAKGGAKKITIINRNQQRSAKIINDFAKLAEFEAIDWDFDDKILQNCDLLINSTSLGLEGKSDIEINFAALNQKALVSDIVYNPLLTRFLQQAQQHGNPIATGLGMLIFQAFVGFEKWFEVAPKFDKGLEDILSF